MIIVSILAGIIVLLAGVLRLGRMVGYIPWPVIEGFTVGIGVIIFLQQIPAAVGVSAEGRSTNALIAAFQAVMDASWPAALFPIAAVLAVVVLIVIFTLIHPRIPASFLAIVVVSIVTVLASLPLTTIGVLPHSLPAPSIPTITLDNLGQLAAPAFAVAALAAIESLLSARVAATMGNTGPVNADRELVGQGLASIASGFFGGMPATGAIARTAVNVRAGARTRLASAVHALALLAVVMVAAEVVSQIPLAALSGVLMVTAARMVSPSAMKQVMRSTRSDALVFVITAIVTISFDLILAVGIGIAVAAFFALRGLVRASGARRESLPGDSHEHDDLIALFRIDGSLFFGAAEGIVEKINSFSGIRVVILRLSQLQVVDATGGHTLAEIMNSLERRGITVLIKGIRPEHLPILKRLGVIDALRHKNHLFAELQPAIDHARDHVRRHIAEISG